MMSLSFINDDFLLENEMARRLYHHYAESMPIIDYHNHLPPDEIANNKQFKSITEVWLNGDHYKWRAMRALGISEDYITGGASDQEKFQKWAEAVPYTIRNPLFHWTHLELKRYFDIDELLNEKNGANIFDECNEKLQQEDFKAHGLLTKMGVEYVCTTDDPVDALENHIKHKKSSSKPGMFPAFRPDNAILLNKDSYLDYIHKLEVSIDSSINSYNDLLAALEKRIDFFHENGCRISDHGLNKVYGRSTSPWEQNQIFRKRLAGELPDETDYKKFISGLMHDLGEMYANKDWAMQLHIGALRNNNQRMLRELGPDTGFDSIGDYEIGKDLSAFLNGLDAINKLPRTILYNLNPRDNELMVTMSGNYNDGSVKGKMQFGSAWWFLDQKDGMEKQINALSNMGMLSCFIGMLTDSRSFLSFPRHEYFRRILCNLFGIDVEKGELPNDEKWLGGIIQDICYNNAKEYFKLNQ